ncbi:MULTISPECIES: Crp/Fnr family transcriptional regulator [Thiorhodovibrio]|uniref:Crp/Fnr family transcriptional regulator n=1 Tax=Thiorhodovibrio TaxID=61593 RepID=UPI0019127422|nr:MULTISPECIES: Crp/Fnr family transcriptional regulator [Thiorhodovibrio]MBK5969469.1 hypothetical protein [Thiorhodovibrio winogradskyi]WPL11929.1 cAMP regulatory protein [Thiorhodovibrio litoralis]
MHPDTRAITSLSLLETIPVFARAPRAALHFLAAGCHPRQARRGQVLCSRGEHLDGFNILECGRVKLSLLSANGGERVLEILRPPRTFGEAAAFLGQPCALHAEALSDARLLFVEVRQVRAAIPLWPEVAELMLRLVAGRAQRLLVDLEACCLHTAAERVAALLLREACPSATEPDSAQLELPASKILVASSVNLSPETFSRELHALARRGLIRVERRRIHIPSLARLGQLGGLAVADIACPDLAPLSA